MQFPLSAKIWDEYMGEHDDAPWVTPLWTVFVFLVVVIMVFPTPSMIRHRTGPYRHHANLGDILPGERDRFCWGRDLYALFDLGSLDGKSSGGLG